MQVLLEEGALEWRAVSRGNGGICSVFQEPRCRVRLLTLLSFPPSPPPTAMHRQELPEPLTAALDSMCAERRQLESLAGERERYFKTEGRKLVEAFVEQAAAKARPRASGAFPFLAHLT